MSYVRWSTPIPLSKPCRTCGRLDEGQYPGDGFDRSMACHEHQMRWAKGPWWSRLFSAVVWFVFGRKGSLTGRPAAWLFGRSRGLCPECTSGWYVYHDMSDRLAVWAARADEMPMYSLEEVKDIVDTGDFARVPGFAELGDQGVLREAMESAIDDWDDD